MPSTFGLFFLGVAAFFYATRYICAAAICVGLTSAGTGIGPDLFNEVYKDIGSELTILSLVSFLIGIRILLRHFYPKVEQAFKREFNQPPPQS